MKSSEAKPTDEDLDEISDEGSMSASEGDEDDEDMEDGLVDMEDLGKVMKKRKNPDSAGEPKVSAKPTSKKISWSFDGI